MFYKHRFFSINTKSRQVYNEHGKELKITGNSFRVLVFLRAWPGDHY